MRYDSEHKERTHHQILDEAASVIRSKGPDRVGVAEVMARLGLTHGGFYAHFASKDELIAQALSYMVDQSFARFVRYTEGREPREALAAYVDSYLTVAHRDAPGRGCPYAALSGDLPRMSEAARVRFTAGLERLVGGIARLLKKLGTRDAHALASSVVSELVGALALSRAISDPRRSEELLRASRRTAKQRLGAADA